MDRCEWGGDVAAQFDRRVKKDERWQFIHAIPVGSRGSDIDHPVIGPGGVFTVNTKNHPNEKIRVGGDTFTVNGSRQPCVRTWPSKAESAVRVALGASSQHGAGRVRNARHEAARASKLLSEACGRPVFVEAVISMVNAIEVTIKSPSTDVTVVPRRQIATWLSRHGDVLDPSQQASIFDAAGRSTNWRSSEASRPQESPPRGRYLSRADVGGLRPWRDAAANVVGLPSHVVSSGRGGSLILAGGIGPPADQ